MFCLFSCVRQEKPALNPGTRVALVISGSEKGVFWKRCLQKSPLSRDSREVRDSRDFRESPDSGKQRRIRPFSTDSRELKILEILEIPPAKRPLS